MQSLRAIFWQTAILAVCFPLAANFASAQAPNKKPQVEVVFCLDTTGSMGGLINAAKQKIWAISNQIAGGQPTPTLKIGLIAYRDRQDTYTTKVYPLTDDLDAIYGHLMKLKANGGGDFPESVNQALHESVTKIKWSKGANTLKIIFLVGDAPPKIYAGDVEYQQTCKLAARSNIIVNTIQCGNHAQTQTAWKDICRLAEGSYVQIDARGGPVVVVKTPFDKELATINRELTKSTLTYGDSGERKDADRKARLAATLPPAAAASRAGYAGKSGKTAAYDLLDNIKAGRVQLEKLKKEELPTQLQGLDLKGQRSYLQKVEIDRVKLQRRAVELDQKRNAHIMRVQNEQGKNQKLDSFDQQVLRLLQTQARRVNLRYADPAIKK